MPFTFEFNEEKNQLLKETRGVNFNDIINALEKGNFLADLVHHSQSRKNQRILVVKIKRYVYAVPYLQKTRRTLFLKTVYPSRILTRKYLK